MSGPVGVRPFFFPKCHGSSSLLPLRRKVESFFCLDRAPPFCRPRTFKTEEFFSLSLSLTLRVSYKETYCPPVLLPSHILSHGRVTFSFLSTFGPPPQFFFERWRGLPMKRAVPPYLTVMYWLCLRKKWPPFHGFLLCFFFIGLLLFPM